MLICVQRNLIKFRRDNLSIFVDDSIKVKNLYFYKSFRLYKLEILVFSRLLGILESKLSGGVL